MALPGENGGAPFRNYFIKDSSVDIFALPAYGMPPAWLFGVWIPLGSLGLPSFNRTIGIAILALLFCYPTFIGAPGLYFDWSILFNFD